MLCRTHILGGVFAGLALSTKFTGIDTLFISCVGSVIGSTIPDIDGHNSFITKKTSLFGKIISKIAKHRGILHTPFFYIVTNLIIYEILISQVHTEYLRLFIFSLFIGEISHLILDSLNPIGIMILWTYIKKRFRFMRITTGSKVENVVAGILFLLCCVTFVIRLKMIF